MAFKDNRDFIKALIKSGDIVVVKKEVDWDLEAAAISRRACELSGPAVLFERIRDYPAGYRIFGGPVATFRRVAIALGLPPDTSIKQIHDIYEEREGRPVPGKLVKTGPCKENRMTGDDVDLFRFPSPMVHDGDGGRYIGTWGYLVSKDPDSDWTNWGMYRAHINSKNSLSMSPAPGSNLGTLFRQKFIPNNLPMQVALVIGADPLSSIAASAGYPVGQSEVNLAGGLRQEPVELVKCETNDLLVPAYSEIVIEGLILPDVSSVEGPFGEYPGYRSPGFEAKLYCKIEAITFRNSPIITMSVIGVPPDDSHIGGAIGVSLAIKRRLQQKGIPVIDAYQFPEGSGLAVVISVSKGGPEIANMVARAFGIRRAWITKIIVVDDDVDVFDIRQVIHAFSVKCHSTRGIKLIETPEGTGNPFAALYSIEEASELKGAVAVFDATWDPNRAKSDLPVKASFESIYPEELRKKILDNWTEYGFK